jgi:hypothetical protein
MRSCRTQLGFLATEQRNTAQSLPIERRRPSGDAALFSCREIAITGSSSRGRAA